MIDTYGTDRYPWEQQPGETSAAHAAFTIYRDLGWRRTLRDAAKVHYSIPDADYDPSGGKIRTIEKWSSGNRWVARCEEYDRWIQGVSDATAVEDIRSMKVRHAQVATLVQNKAIMFLQSLTDEKLKQMNPEAVMRMFDLAVKNERLARDVPDSIQSIVGRDGGPLEMANVSEETLERKLQAFLRSKDPNNTLEAGEPYRASDDDLAPVERQRWPDSATDGEVDPEDG